MIINIPSRSIKISTISLEIVLNGQNGNICIIGPERSVSHYESLQTCSGGEPERYVSIRVLINIDQSLI